MLTITPDVLGSARGRNETAPQRLIEVRFERKRYEREANIFSGVTGRGFALQRHLVEETRRAATSAVRRLFERNARPVFFDFELSYGRAISS